MLNVEQFKARISAYFYDNFYKQSVNKDQVYVNLKRQIPPYFKCYEHDAAVTYITKLLKY